MRSASPWKASTAASRSAGVAARRDQRRRLAARHLDREARARTARRRAALGAAARAISWPSQPVPSWKPLHSQSTAAPRVAAGGAAPASSPAIGVAMTIRPPRACAHRGGEVARRSAAPAAARSRAGSARCGARPHLRRLRRVARPQRASRARAAAWTASAVPHAPAPSTVRFIGAAVAGDGQPSMLGDDARAVGRAGRLGLRPAACCASNIAWKFTSDSSTGGKPARVQTSETMARRYG